MIHKAGIAKEPNVNLAYNDYFDSKIILLTLISLSYFGINYESKDI